jgi:hypothetical protein
MFSSAPTRGGEASPNTASASSSSGTRRAARYRQGDRERHAIHGVHLTVNLGINYGGRDEIIRAVRRHMDRVPGAAYRGRLRHPRPAVAPIPTWIRTANEQGSIFCLSPPIPSHQPQAARLGPFDALDDYSPVTTIRGAS